MSWLIYCTKISVTFDTPILVAAELPLVWVQPFDCFKRYVLLLIREIAAAIIGRHVDIYHWRIVGLKFF